METKKIAIPENEYTEESFDREKAADILSECEGFLASEIEDARKNGDFYLREYSSTGLLELWRDGYDSPHAVNSGWGWVE